jgi:hypothetical protein
LPDPEALQRYQDELPLEEAFEPAQMALVRLAIKWLRLLRPEERQENRGILVEFEPYAPGGIPVDDFVPVHVTLLKREEAAARGAPGQGHGGEP